MWHLGREMRGTARLGRGWEGVVDRRIQAKLLMGRMAMGRVEKGVAAAVAAADAGTRWGGSRSRPHTKTAAW